MLIVLGLSLWPTVAVHAATITVNDNGDSGALAACTLRDAVESAHTDSPVNGCASGTAGPDTIIFSQGLDISGLPIMLSDQITITQDVTIDGSVNGPVRVDGGSVTRLFNVQSGNVTFNGLILQNGKDSSSDCANLSCGGAIKIERTAVVTVTNTIVDSNSASEDGEGGGIRNGGNLTIINSVFVSNTAGIGNSVGGGIYTNGTIEISNSTLNGNSSSQGGGIYNVGTATISNSTLSDNSANLGGGLFHRSRAELTHVTMVDNGTPAGGGNLRLADGAAITLTNSIIAYSSSEGTACVLNDSNGINILNATASNLDSDGSCTGADTATTLGLAPLADNGGTVPLPDGTYPQTHALLPDSDAIDAATTATTLSTDQRGAVRIHGPFADIGAFETAPGLPTCVGEKILHVKENADGQGDGSSWEDAFPFLQDALLVSDACEIWVAKGIYYPDQGSGQLEDDPNSTFFLRDEVAIYGGFDGTETERSQRDWQTNITILSGDIDQNDATETDGLLFTTENITGTNAFHVITGLVVNTTAKLDGFVVTAGNAIGGSLSPFLGGGMINIDASPTLTNLTFRANSADFGGGGMDNSSSSPILTNVTFSKNAAVFTSGGGMSNLGSSPTLTNVTFRANRAQEDGGGMANSGGSNPILNNVTFDANTAVRFGGGMSNLESNPSLTSVSFNANRASSAGGGMVNQNSSPTLFNVIFNANITSSGGGMANLESNPVLTNVTFGTHRGSNGTGILNQNSSPVLTNVIIWGNTREEDKSIANLESSNPTINFSLIEGFALAELGGEGNLDGTDPANDPRFVRNGDTLLTPTLLGDLRLRPGSPVIDKGTNDVPGLADIATDFANNPRIQDGVIDMGAYEMLACPSAGVLHVKAGGDGSNNGDSWENAMDLLQNALGVGEPCEIWVAQGVYYPDEGSGQSEDSHNSTFNLMDGVSVYGGFDGTEEQRDQRDWQTNITVLSGDIDGNDKVDAIHVVTSTDNISGTNALHVVTAFGISTTTTFDGFIITGGRAIGQGVEAILGGGMRNSRSSPTMSNLIFKGNQAQRSGGGLFNGVSSPLMDNVIFLNNRAQFGGGVANDGNSSPIMTDIVFQSNQAGTSGGGLHNVSNSNPAMTNVIFQANRAQFGGGISNSSNTRPILTNVTLHGNIVTELNGGGIYNVSNSSPILTNVILWENRSTVFDTPNQIHNDDDSNTPIISHSLIQGSNGSGDSWLDELGIDGGNNIDVDPLFVQEVDTAIDPPISGDLHLQADSPAIDAGNTLSITIPISIATDLDGNPRVLDDAVDMGAFEFGTSTPTNTVPIANETLIDVPGPTKPVLLSGFDDDGDPLTFIIVTQPANGTLSNPGPVLTSPSLTYTPDADFSGIDSFTFKVNDGSADSDPATVTIRVESTGVDAPPTRPIANPQIVNTEVDQTKVITLTGSDEDNAPLTARIIDEPINGTVSISGTTAIYTPTLGFIGRDSFTFVFNNGTVSSEPALITIDVSAEPPSNTVPVANPQTVNVEQGQAISMTLTSSDADGDTLTFIIITQPANGTLSGTAPNLTYTPNPGFAETDSFTYKVNDGQVDSAPATVTIRVEPTPEGTTNAGIFLPYVSGQ